MSLPPYEPYGPCPKCGRTVGRSEKPLVKYCAGVVVVQASGPRPPTEEPCQHDAQGEHLTRGCYDCHYEWLESPIGEPPLTGEEIALLRKALVTP